MTTVRKLGTFRQLSLQCDSPKYNNRNKTLKKQFSEDVPDETIKWETEPKIRISLSAKNRTKNSDRPPPIKLAWSENIQKSLDEQIFKRDEGIVAKKCKEAKRPVTAKIRKQSSLDRDSILYSRQELAERLRQAWEDREKGKQNLDIFLAPNTKHEDDCNYETTDNESSILQESYNKKNEPKILQALNKHILEENSLKNIFQKQIRKNNRNRSVDFPHTFEKNHQSTIVVVPIVENGNKPSPRQTKPENPDRTNKNEPETSNPINVIIRPATALTRREIFQKRTNSAFNELTKKPPLTRAVSVPNKLDQKSKFVASKKRIKSSKKRDKNDKLSELSLSDEEKDLSDRQNRKKCLQRCVSLSGTEIETMVSLVSPDNSDVEEIAEKPKDKEKSKTSSPTKTNLLKEEKNENKNFTLRKTVKSVSFQQSSIHAVRSFSASFPARRGSVATTLMLGNNATSQKNKTCIDPTDNNDRGPKRRLLRTKSVPLAISTTHLTTTLDEITESKSEENITVTSPDKDEKTEKKLPIEDAGNPENSYEIIDEANMETDNSEPEFESDKEKQCWEMYCKMSEKGVNVSFDTILRGMLTPTEYRMRKKSLVPTDAASNIEESS